jgi:hypothetical protein
MQCHQASLAVAGEDDWCVVGFGDNLVDESG